MRNLIVSSRRTSLLTYDFRNKVSKIRIATSNVQPPVIQSRSCPVLSDFRPVSAEEISKIIGSSPAKHCAMDPAPTWLIKRLIPDLAETIAKMCNLSLSEGIFPDCLKNAIVRPRLKKTNLDPEDMNSYRPISNLTFLSKTVERVVAIRFVEHSELHKLMLCHQSAYRSFHSTETAVLAVHNDIVRTIDSGKISGLVLLDLSAAFDTVDHPVLLQVLRDRFCVRGGALGWFGSYLSNRTQTYQVKDQQSSPRLVDCSVPQGSVLGPQGFIAYTEDLAELIEEHLLGHHMYADDTQLMAHLTINDIPSVATRLQNCIEAIQVWCNSRRLQLNPTKTELIWFGSKTNLKKIADLDLNLYIGPDIIKPVNVVRDLGVYLDSELSMEHHISTVVRACFFHLRRLKSIRRILGADVTSGLVSAFVTTRMDYCNSILAALPQSSIDPLQRVQNAAARLITGTGTREHITPALRSLHWLPVKFRITFKLCVLMHLVHIGRAPAYLSDMVTATADLSGRGRLRSSNTFRYELPLLKRKFGERSFSYAGPKAWNDLPFALPRTY